MKIKKYNKNNLFSFFFFHFSLKIFFHFSFFIFLFSCKESTSPQTVTFSGTVTLEDTTDYSGVEVMLFKPVEIDTALLNLNKNYPGVGIEVNQRTEFYWREHEPVYKTTTKEDGNWKIESVEPGEYHIVYKKNGYGWQVKYNQIIEAQFNSIKLKKEIVWDGAYSGNILIPESSFVSVERNTIFNKGSMLIIKPGAIVEFKNDNISITSNGDVFIIGKENDPVYFLANDTSNINSFNIFEINKLDIKYSIFIGVNYGIYIKKTPIVNIAFSRFKNEHEAIKIFDSDSVYIHHNIISNINFSGLLTQQTQLRLEKNILYYCNRMGLESKNARNSFLKYNLFKNCYEYAISMNFEGTHYYESNLEILYCNFINNDNHIYIGDKAFCRGNFNNFFNVKNYIIRTKLRSVEDTLDFVENFWNYYDEYSIKMKIFDVHDNNSNKPFKGPIVDFDKYKKQKIIW
ncbi:right-handed parallel beta-helix repeat-containing protein [Calditrichota bacterium LG25]